MFEPLKIALGLRKFSRWVLLVDSSDGVSLWDYQSFREIFFTHLSQLLGMCMGSASVHSRQVTKKGTQEVSFGALDWSLESAEKWCHSSPLTASRSDEWLLVDTQVFCPGKEYLVRNHSLPQVYFQLKPIVP